MTKAKARKRPDALRPRDERAELMWPADDTVAAHDAHERGATTAG